jgi:hypothetical protein
VTAAADGERPRGRWVLAIVAFTLLVGGVAWLAFEQGRRSARAAAPAHARRGVVLEAQLDQLQLENERLHSRVAELDMARRLDRDAYGEIERTLGDLQSRLSRQGDDLTFYRSIVSPADGIQGLRIQRLDLQPGSGPREVVLSLTLVQAMRHESNVSGLAQITIAGMQGETPAKYTVGELLGRPRAQLPFSFRYFQRLEQSVTLPEGFEPFEADVRLQSSKMRGPVQQSFPWKMTARAGQPSPDHRPENASPEI